MQTENQLELSELKRAWIDSAEPLVIALLPRLGQFTAEKLRAFLPEPDHPNWWGCLMAALRCTGKIREVGRVRSNRPERNGAKIGLYEAV